MKKWAIVIAMAFFPLAIHSTIYQCEGEYGTIKFSDAPCSGGLEVQVDTNQKMFSGSTWKPRVWSELEPTHKAKPAKTPNPTPMPRRSFDCHDITVTGFTPYKNLVGDTNNTPSSMPIAQYQCASGRFRLRQGRQARWNDRTFAENVANTIAAKLSNGETRTTDRAFMPHESQVSRFTQLKEYSFDVCYGASPFHIVELKCL